MRWLWLVLILTLVIRGAPSQAQADPWHSGEVGVRWALRADDVLLGTSTDGLLASVDAPPWPELLIAADNRGAIGIDVRQARVAWEYRRPIEDRYAGSTTPPLVQDGRLYLYNTVLDARSGQQLWQAQTGAVVSMWLAGDVLYLVGLQDTWAVNPQNGQILWQRGVEVGTGQSGGRPLLLGDRLVVHYGDGQVWGLDARSGRPSWHLPFKVTGKNTLTGSAGLVFAPKADLGQLLAFAAADGTARWTYPAMDAVGTYAAPRLEGGAIPLVDGDTLYVVDVEGRILALEAQSGATRWASEPVLADHSGSSSLRRVGQTLVAGDSKTSLVGLDANTGQFRWRLDGGAGRVLSVVADDLLLVGSQENGIRLVQVETGQVAGKLEPESRPPRWNENVTSYEAWGAPYHDAFPPGSAHALVEGSGGFVYLVQDFYVVALGPAAPDEAVDMARVFLSRGDYRSAARTLSLLKTSDEQGYLAHGGEAIATEALSSWLDDFEQRTASGSFQNLTSIYWPDDLSYDVARLGIREIQAHMKYADALVAVWEFENVRGKRGGLRSAEQIREVRQLKERYGDTVWAERMAGLLATQHKLAAPRIRLGGPAYLGWWYLPFALPLAVLLTGVLISRRRQGIYRAAVTAGLSIWGGLVYLFWAGRLLTNPGSGYYMFAPVLGLDLGLIGGVPLAVLLLTRSKNLALVTLVVSVVHRFVIYNTLLTMLG